MRKIFLKSFTLLLLSSSVLLSCTKQNEQPSTQATMVSSDDISEADAPGVYTTPAGYIKLVLQPGPDKAQDSWIDYFTGFDSATYNNGNAGTLDQLKCVTWTLDDGIVTERSLIRFDGLSLVPTGSDIISAKMFLISPSSSPITLPQGNSVYPGSPYNSFGPNFVSVERIISPWDQSTVTWNNQPGTTLSGVSTIPRSTEQWNYVAAADVTKIVKYNVSNPGSNYGFMLKLENEIFYNSMGFCSAENSEFSRRPKLVIVYKK